VDDRLADSVRQRLLNIARAEGVYGHVPLEVAFYRGDYFTRGLAFFLLSFLLVAFSWLKRSRLLDIGIWLTLLGGTVARLGAESGVATPGHAAVAALLAPWRDGAPAT